MGEEARLDLERRLMLQAFDDCWADHLAAVTEIRDSIHLAEVGGLDPFREFLKQAAGSFQETLASVDQRALEKPAALKLVPEGISLEKLGLDIFIGAIFLMFAIGPFLTPYLGDFWGTVIFVPFWGIIFVALWLIRKFVVKPRVGLFEYGTWRKKRMMRISLVMVAVFTLTFLLGLLSTLQFEAIPGWMHTARFSLVILLTFSAVAYFLDIGRLYFYGILIARAPLVGELLWVYLDVPHHGYPITFGLVAMVIVGTGWPC
jgi:hypothetical protein